MTTTSAGIMQEVAPIPPFQKILQVNEIFGPTIQGEGPRTGCHCLFLRLFNCNQECKWCDTAYTWAVTKAKAARTISGKQYSRELERHEMSAEQVLDKLERLWSWRTSPTNIIISGGEPMMQQEALVPVIAALDQADCPIHIETAGTILPVHPITYLVSQFVVSPKLANSGNLVSKRYKPHVLKWFNEHNATFKFVVEKLSDFIEIDALAAEIMIPANRIMIMPEGTTVASQLMTGRAIVDDTLKRGYGLSLREHILVWGDERAR